MASFIHLSDAKNQRLIEKSGIKTMSRGVHALPITTNFAITHQWSRELKRRGIRSLICVQFRLPDDEMVSIGRYNGEKISATAAESVTIVTNHAAPFGLEVIIPRKVKPSEIIRIYAAPRITGWRYYPEAKGRQPFCHCRFCNRGEIRAQRLIRDDF